MSLEAAGSAANLEALLQQPNRVWLATAKQYYTQLQQI